MTQLRTSLLKRSGGLYSLRVYIPTSLQHAHRTASGKPRKELVKALGTRDLTEARRLRDEMMPAITKEVYRLPDAEDYKVRPFKVVEEQYAEPGPDAKLGDPLVVESIEEFIERDHPELTDRADEIERVAGLAAAKAWVAEVRGEITLSTAPDAFKKNCEIEGKIRPGTVGKHYTNQTEFVAWFGNSTDKLSEVTVEDAYQYRDWMVSEGYAGKTVNNKTSSLSQLWRWVRKRGLVSANIWADMAVSAENKTAKRAFTPDEARRVLTALRSDKRGEHYDLAVLLLFTGSRLEEICSLTIGDLTRPKTSEEITGFTAHGGKPGEGAAHWIPVVAGAALDILEARAKGKTPEDRLFAELTKGANGKWSQNVGKTLIRATRKALGRATGGSSEVDNHSWRRTHATAAENAGLLPHEIDRLQRRQSGNLAIDTYSSGPTAERKVDLQQSVTDQIVQAILDQP